ncbi:MAG TPA: amidase family protein, partial [Methylomirabilota bacterium]|nr:amidase family protein [Methylomirabilota bacterium]
AVAARMAPLAIAEDTWASIRVPSSMCGLTGLRPTFGRYPGAGIMPITADRFDQAGPVARSVADLVLFDSVMTGTGAAVAARPLAGARIGIWPDYFMAGLDPEVERVTQSALKRLEAAGATLVTSDAPPLIKSAIPVVSTILRYEAASAITAYLQAYNTGVTFEQLVDQISPNVQGVFKAMVLPGAPNRPTREAYEKALKERGEVTAAIRDEFDRQRIEALAFPPILTPALPLGDNPTVEIGGQKVPLVQVMGRNAAPGTCAALASLVLPAGMTARGLPVGIEFDAVSGRDRELLALGLSLEKALGPIPAPRA